MKKQILHISALFTSILLMTSVQFPVSAASIGDTDTDGIVNAADASQILIRAAELGTGEAAGSEELAVMDVNGDAQINAIDASVLLNYAAKAGASAEIPAFSEYVAQRLAEPQFDGAQYVSMTLPDIYRTLTGDTLSRSAHTSFLITAPEELEAFVGTMNGINDGFWTRRSTDAENEKNVPIADTVAKYDEEWFQEHDLIMVIAVESATQFYHAVRGIKENEDGSWTVSIDRMIPLASEQSLPSFAIFVETNKAVEFAPSVNLEKTNIYIE